MGACGLGGGAASCTGGRHHRDHCCPDREVRPRARRSNGRKERSQSMKKLSLIVVCLCSSAFAQGGSVSTAFEPAVVPIQNNFSFGVAVAGSLNLTPNNWASVQYGYSDSVTPTHTALLGVGRSLLEFLPGATLVGTLQVGRTFSRAGDRSLRSE